MAGRPLALRRWCSLPVVGQDALDDDGLVCEVSERPLQEGGGCHAALVREGLRVGVAGVVVHSHVDVVEA